MSLESVPDDSSWALPTTAESPLEVTLPSLAVLPRLIKAAEIFHTTPESVNDFCVGLGLDNLLLEDGEKLFLRDEAGLCEYLVWHDLRFVDGELPNTIMLSGIYDAISAEFDGSQLPPAEDLGIIVVVGQKYRDLLMREANQYGLTIEEMLLRFTNMGIYALNGILARKNLGHEKDGRQEPYAFDFS